MCKQQLQIAYPLFKQAYPRNYSQGRYALKLKSRLSHHMNKGRSINVQNDNVQHCSFFIQLMEDGGRIICFPVYVKTIHLNELTLV